MTQLYIIRHGNTFDPGDTVTRVGARTDLPLSQSGKQQALHLRDHFQNALPHGFARAYCSSLARTRQTAEIILAGSVDPPSLETLPFLKEIDYGPDENQPEDKVEARVGREALELWDREAKPPAGWKVDPHQLTQEWGALVDRLQTEKPDRPVLLVTSNGIARFALRVVTTDLSRAGSIKLKTGAFGQLSLSGQEVRLLSWNLRPQTVV